MPGARRNTHCLPPCSRPRPSAALLEQIAQLNGDATPLGRAHAALADAASVAVASDVEREYFDLFVGLGRGELLPYASYYLTGFLNERPLSRLRDDLAALGIERVENNFEPEDHAATLCEIMAGFAAARFAGIAGEHSAPSSRSTCPAGWDVCSPTWRSAESAKFYRSVGRSDGCFWKSNPRLSRSPTDQRRWSGRDAMSDEKKTTVGRRDFLRKVGIGTVGAGRRWQHRLIDVRAGRQRDRPGEAQGALQGNRSRESVLPRQSLSWLREAAVLIKRTQQRSEAASRGSIAAALSGQSGGFDRRTFLRRSGLAGGALAALSTLPIGSVRKAEAAVAGPLTSGATVRKSICTHCSVGCTVTAEVLNGVWIGQEPTWDSRSIAARIVPRALPCASSCTATVGCAIR